MGLNEIFRDIFHGSQHTAVGKNRPYFLRSVELIKALKDLSDLKGNGQKELPKLYNQLQQVLEMAADATGQDARKGEDEKLNKMFDEAIRHVHAFLQKHHSAHRAQMFTDNMKKAWEGDSGSVKKITIMEGRIYEMMKKYKTMKKTTYLLRHWLQPKVPSINTSDWVNYALSCQYEAEDGITVEEFLNRLLTTMMAEKTQGFRNNFLLLSPKLYYNPIVDTSDFLNIKRHGEKHAPGRPNKILNDIKSPKFELAFDFADNKYASLQDLIYRTFNTDSRDAYSKEVLGWLSQWKNAYWSRCPANDAFEWTRNKEKDCSYKDELHEGHVIYRDEEGNMQHMLILKGHIRKEPLPDKEKFDPKKVLQEQPSKEETPAADKPSELSRHPPSLSIPGSSVTQDTPTTPTPSTPIPANHLNIGESQRKLGRAHMARAPPPTPKKQSRLGRFLNMFSSSKTNDED